MAHVQTILCSKCKQNKIATNSNTICNDCQKSIRDREDLEYYQKLSNMSIEERLRKLEIEIHEHNKLKHSSDHIRF